MSLVDSRVLSTGGRCTGAARRRGAVPGVVVPGWVVVQGVYQGGGVPGYLYCT